MTNHIISRGCTCLCQHYQSVLAALQVADFLNELHFDKTLFDILDIFGGVLAASGAVEVSNGLKLSEYDHCAGFRLYYQVLMAPKVDFVAEITEFIAKSVQNQLKLLNITAGTAIEQIIVNNLSK